MKVKRVKLDELHSVLTSNVNCEHLIIPKDTEKFSREKIFSEELAVIFDWDDTLTKPGINNNSWQIANNAFSKTGERKDILLLDKMSKKYHEIEKQRPLTRKEMKEWQRLNMQMYVDYELNLNCLEKEIQKSRIYLSGAILILYLLENYSKVCIISSGIKNIINSTLNYYGINSKEYGNLQINATELIFNNKGIITGWEDNSIVTAEKKPWLVHGFARIWDIPHENIFVVGDGNTDLNMLDLVSKEATMIFFCPSHKKESLTKERFNLISSKAHGFVKENFSVITNFFIETIEA